MANGEPFVDLTVSDDGYAQTSEAEGPTVLLPGANQPPRVIPEVASWLSAGSIVVELRLPHSNGMTHMPGSPGVGPPPPALRWQSVEGRPREAMRERFRSLISDALSDAGGPEAAIRPSGITNSVLTETLREYAGLGRDGGRIDLPVRYVDGSSGPTFPLGAFPLSSESPVALRELRFTLLSIRHVEMDGIVDGAWLRNSRISIRRPQGLTDQIAFETSRRQLRLLGDRGSTKIHIYQTGFEPAILAFYRAVLLHLMECPRSISVVPHYFLGKGEFAEGTPWTMA